MPDGQAPVSAANKQLQGELIHADSVTQVEFSTPRALETNEIPGIVKDFQLAARNAMRAGFDGVEIHASDGFLIDQFLKDGVNDRRDEYGGSLENRCRLAFEIVEAVSAEIGAGRVGIRLAPFSDYMDAKDSNPQHLGTYLAENLNRFNILYTHLVEPRENIAPVNHDPRALLPITTAFKGAIIVAGGYDRDEGNQAISSGKADLVAYGRLFISNPDLPKRFQLNAPLNEYKRETFYLTGSADPHVGYTDYQFLEE